MTHRGETKWRSLNKWTEKCHYYVECECLMSVSAWPLLSVRWLHFRDDFELNLRPSGWLLGSRCKLEICVQEDRAKLTHWSSSVRELGGKKHVVVFTFPSLRQQTFSLSLSLQFLTRLLPLPVVFAVPPSFQNFLPAFARSPSTSLHPKPPLPPLSVSLPPSPSPPPPSLSMDNSSVFLRAAVCLPAYCDFHWDSFRDHSHLSWELEARLWREINHSHLILTRIHKHTHRNTHTYRHRRMFHSTFFFCF